MDEETLLEKIAEVIGTEPEELLIYKQEREGGYIYTNYPGYRFPVSELCPLLKIEGLNEIIIQMDGRLDFKTRKW